MDSTADNKQKKRHRHSTEQLVALNELYEQDEHPALHLRTALATKIGMETKTVNAWFQNKRASNRKRTRNNKNSSTAARTADSQDHSEDEYYASPESAAPMHGDASLPASDLASHASMTYPDPSYFAPDSITHLPMAYPSMEQMEDLRAYFHVSPHPSKDDKELLSDRIGLRYQIVSLWFQEQRSEMRRRKEEEGDYGAAAFYAEIEPSSELFDGFPSGQPGRPYPPPPLRTRSSSVTPSSGSSSSRRSGSTPYGHPVLSSMSQRARRTRPEAHQLDALKELFTRTQHPSLEERTALALELGMDIRKVTNWFRNLRQTSRKRARKSRSDDEEDDDMYTSRFRSPSGSASAFDQDMDRVYKTYSEMDSDDDYQEAVTPSPEHSPSPPPESSPRYRRLHAEAMNFEHDTLSPIDKAAFARYAHIKYEDAMLLLDFHQHIVHLR